MAIQNIGLVSTEYQNRSAAAAWAFGEIGTNPKIVNGIIPLVNSFTFSAIAQLIINAANETDEHLRDGIRQDREDAAERARRREQAARAKGKPLTKQMQTISQTQAPRWVHETTAATPTQSASVLTKPETHDAETWKFYILLVTAKV